MSPTSKSVLFASPPSPLTFRIKEELPRIPSALTPSPFFATPEFQKPKLLVNSLGHKTTAPTKAQLPVDEDYNFPRSELAAMAKNIARLIDDIDRLDINRRNMMDELKVLRDVTLFYNEQHPELRTAAKKPATEDAVDADKTRDGEGARTSTPEM